MSVLSKIIDSLTISVHTAEMREVLKPLHISGIVMPLNYLTQLNKGTLYNDSNPVPMKEGSFIFQPAGSVITTKFMKAEQYRVISQMLFESEEERQEYMRTLNPMEKIPYGKEIFSFVAFDVQLYGAIPFFKVLEFGAVDIPYDEELSVLLQNLCLEFAQKRIGKVRLLKNYTEELVIHILRYVASQPEYEKKIEKMNFLTDERLVTIIQYISNNLSGDLSNKRLAEIVFLSEDYIGQFFKSLTGNNLQDYVEYQRLERACQMLISTSDNIQQISQSVGFKDPAYFSRRFKMKYNMNANAMRKLEEGII
ncbi:MAG TPA: AraC family transcriptional regulator [Bacteroidia bacterium]|nr:AraC family transcriptional regulator [Bacteroidia bacterium]